MNLHDVNAYEQFKQRIKVSYLLSKHFFISPALFLSENPPRGRKINLGRFFPEYHARCVMTMLAEVFA